MALVSFFSFLVTLIVVTEIIVRNSDFFSPGRIFIMAHSIALGVAFLALDKAMTPFKPFTSVIYFGGAACFLLGLAVMGLLLSRPRDSAPELRPDWANYNWTLHLSVTFGVFLISVIGLWGAQSGAGGFPLLAEDKIKVLKLFMKQPSYFMFPFSAAGIAMALFFMYLVSPRSPRFWRNPAFYMIIILFFVFSLVLSRVALMFFIFFAMTFYHQAVRKLSLPKLLGVFAFCFTLVLVTGYFKAKELEKETSVDINKIAAIAFKIPYLYLANNLWNLDFALNPENHRVRYVPTYGYTIASGLLDVPGGQLITGGLPRENTNIDNQFNKRAAKKKGWNTVTYQWALYKDFGMPGVFLGSFAIGLLMGFLYNRIKTGPTLLNLAAYSFLAFFVGNSLFGFFTESPTYTYGFMLLCACCYFCQTIGSGRLLRDST